MLTKTDFAQIRKIIREEIENESTSVKEELGAEIKLSRIELQREVKTVAERVKNLEIAVRKIQKDILSSLISWLPQRSTVNIFGDFL
jgi:seryl-tRNA synthetase